MNALSKSQAQVEAATDAAPVEYVYQFLTTPELTEADLQGMCDLFEASFEKKGTPARLREKYSGTALGHSFHALLRHNDAGIVGSWNALPQTWRIDGQEANLAVSVDTMIHPAFRTDPLKLWRLANGTEAMLKKAGIPFVFGFPNDNSYVYMQRFAKWKPVGELPFYILPLRPGAKVKLLKALDGVFEAAVSTFVRLLPLGRVQPPTPTSIERVVGPTLETYRAAGNRVLLRGEEGSWLVYSVHLEDNGLKIAYLVDFHPVSRWGFNLALRRLLAERTGADALAYPGTLPFGTHRMFKLPARYVPKPLRLSGKVLLEAPGVARLLDFSQWHINLSSFDVR